MKIHPFVIILVNLSLMQFAFRARKVNVTYVSVQHVTVVCVHVEALSHIGECLSELRSVDLFTTMQLQNALYEQMRNKLANVILITDLFLYMVLSLFFDI